MKNLIRKNEEIIFGKNSSSELIQQYGSPLYLYDEQTLRQQCRNIKSFCTLPNFRVVYSAKANSSIALLKILHEENLMVDAMSIGEIFLEETAGFNTEDILFLSNNVNNENFTKVIEKKIKVCVDSLSQLQRYCSLLSDGGEVYLRLNPLIGAGHHEKVITAGKVKFGIEFKLINEAYQLARKFNVKITGFVVHIGSQFLNYQIFHETILKVLDLAKQYPEIQYIDFGGGFGVVYNDNCEQPFPLKEYSQLFTTTLQKWMEETARTPIFAIEPGRYIVAESGVCLTTVQSTKINAGINFVGTDLGFNFLLRPELYGAYHEIVHATKVSQYQKKVTVVGNVCESGDVLGKDRLLPECNVDDILLIKNTGAYGFVMSSNYNGMCRPAEILIKDNGDALLIRTRETFEDLIRHQI